MAGIGDVNPYAAAGTDLISLYELLVSKLNSTPDPQFSPTPELLASKARADHMAESGYSPQEKGSFRQGVSQDINTQSQNALNLGGGSLAKVIGGIGKINETSAENKFASGDAALHRQNIKYDDKFSEQLQSLSDRNIAEQQRERLMAEQALGGAAQTGLAGLGTGLNYAGLSLGGGKTDTKPDTNSTLISLLKQLGGSSGVGNGNGADYGSNF